MPQITHILIFTKHPMSRWLSNSVELAVLCWLEKLAMLKLLLLMVNHVLSKTIINHFFERFKFDNVSVHGLHGEIRCCTLASKRPWKQRSTVAHHQKAEKGQICVFLARASQRSTCERWKTYEPILNISRFQDFKERFVGTMHSYQVPWRKILVLVREQGGQPTKQLKQKSFIPRKQIDLPGRITHV